MGAVRDRGERGAEEGGSEGRIVDWEESRWEGGGREKKGMSPGGK